MLIKEPMVWAWWGWEPLPFYLRYQKNAAGARGCSDEEIISWYDYLHDEKTVEKAASAGINCVVTHFVKGFGPENERHDIELTADLVKKCHRHGIAVIGYIQYGSIFMESFFEEIPEAKQWHQIKEDGSPVCWGGSRNRYMPCINSDGFLTYLKSMIRRGLLEVGLDGLHFDNSYSPPCYCPRCRENYRKLKGKELPVFKSFESDPYSPEVVEWTKFRCEAMTSRMKELRDHAKSIKPDVLTIWNPNPIRGLLDHRTLRASDFYELGKVAGFLWSESGNFPQMADGSPVHQVNFFKTYESVGCRTFSTVWKKGVEGIGLPTDPREIALLTAECAVFGAVPGNNWLLRPTYRSEFESSGKLYQEFCRQIRYFREHAELFTGTLPGGEIALFFDRDSAALDFAGYYEAFLVLQQLLLQKHFTFDIVFSGDEEKLQKYPLVIAAGEKTLPHANVLRFDHRDLTGFTEGSYAAKVMLPPDADKMASRISAALGEREFSVEAPESVFIEKRKDTSGRTLLHLVNYDISDFVPEIRITFKREAEDLQFISPEKHVSVIRSSHQVQISGLEVWGTLTVR